MCFFQSASDCNCTDKAECCVNEMANENMSFIMLMGVWYVMGPTECNCTRVCV